MNLLTFKFTLYQVSCVYDLVLLVQLPLLLGDCCIPCDHLNTKNNETQNEKSIHLTQFKAFIQILH